MKAVVYTEYGGPDVLKIQAVEKPFPKDNEVLIKVRAVSVNYGDLIARNFRNISTKEFNMPLLFWVLARFGFGLRKTDTCFILPAPRRIIPMPMYPGFR